MHGVSHTDAELIRASLKDLNVFGEVYRRHRDSVFGFVARRAGPEAAADVTAEVFEKAIKARHRYDLSQSNALPWLYGIARNVVGDQSRWWRRQKDLHPLHEPAASHEEEAIQRVMAAAVGKRLQEAVARVNPRDMEPLRLHAIDGLTYSEIGRALGIPPGTVATRIARARSALSEVMPELAQKTDRRYETQGPKTDE